MIHSTTTDWPDWATRMRAELPAMLTKREAANVMRVDTRTLDRMRRAGELESTVLGGLVRVPADAAVSALVAGLSQRSGRGRRVAS